MTTEQQAIDFFHAVKSVFQRRTMGELDDRGSLHAIHTLLEKASGQHDDPVLSRPITRDHEQG